MSNEVGEALERARLHLERAALEGLEAGRALLEAARQASDPDNRSGRSLAAEVLHELEMLIAALRKHAPIELPRSFSDPLSVALEAEIERWERRAHDDPDARTVLRAFLGLRELLWTLGIRPETGRGRSEAPRAQPPDSRFREPSPGRRRRVERFDVED